MQMLGFKVSPILFWIKGKKYQPVMSITGLNDQGLQVSDEYTKNL